MRYKTLLVLKAVVALAFGPLLLLVPGRLFALLGTTLGAGGAFAAREYGAAMCGVFVLTWLARDMRSSGARRPILLAILVYDAVGFVITTQAVLSHVLNPLGWAIAFIYLFFTVGPAYVLIEEGKAKQT